MVSGIAYTLSSITYGISRPSVYLPVNVCYNLYLAFERNAASENYKEAMLPIAVFALTGVVTAKDLKEIDWAVIWMVAGGFALGLAMNCAAW